MSGIRRGLRLVSSVIDVNMILLACAALTLVGALVAQLQGDEVLVHLRIIISMLLIIQIYVRDVAIAARKRGDL